MKKLIIYGFPCIYGGANSELYHQILLWKTMGISMEIIPDVEYYKSMPLYDTISKLNITIRKTDDIASINYNDLIISFGKETFLRKLPAIIKRTRNIIYANCMPTMTILEALCIKNGFISTLLYQSEPIYQKYLPVIKSITRNKNFHVKLVIPYFHSNLFPFNGKRQHEYFGCGRISRRCPDKYSSNIIPIYEQFISPKPKQGIFIGFSDEVLSKIGTPPEWIRTYPNASIISQQEFYRHCEIILQPSDMLENWPRVGFEAMSSGSVLIVDNAGGWRDMVVHGRTGWLCSNNQDFIDYASKMAQEPNMRYEMSLAAKERCHQLSNYELAKSSWENIFETLG